MTLGSHTLQRRFPGMQRELRALALKDERIASLYADLIDAEAALLGWEQSPLAVSIERCQEYKALIESLADEVAEALKQHDPR